mgnify:CR=1 FL=1
MRRPFNRALHATLSGWLVGMLAVGPAAAQQQHVPLRLMPRTLPTAAGPRVAVVAIPVDASLEGEALALTHWAEQAVARSGRLELVRLTDALDAQGAAARQEKAVQGNAAFKEGAKAYDELDTVKALQSFDKAVKAYEQSDLSRAFPLLSRARRRRGSTARTRPRSWRFAACSRWIRAPPSTPTSSRPSPWRSWRRSARRSWTARRPR